jgi:membrane-associated phospholipid phosphatase
MANSHQRTLIRRIAGPAAVIGSVLLLGFALTWTPGIGTWELGADRWLISHLPAFGQTSATAIGTVLEPAGGFALLAVCTLALWLLRSRPAAIRFALVAGVGWLSVEPVKLLVHRPRPVLAGVHLPQESWSYPSGHVALVAALVVGVMAVSGRRARTGVAAVGGLLVVVVAVSRLALGAHYPTDVLASMVWVAAVGLLTVRVLDRPNAFWRNRRHLHAASTVTRPVQLPSSRRAD